MELSIIVPSFKQANTVCDDLVNLTNLLHAIGKTFEIILVVDGDIDATADTVRNNPNLSHVKVITLPDNEGKGAALRQGLLLAEGKIIGFLDAGGDIDMSCLPVMIDLMEFTRADIVIGSKRHELSQVSYPPIRRFYSTGYQILNRLLFRLNVMDTQVGVKIFRKKPLQAILPHVTIKRFAFDLEFLVIASLLGYRKIVESPVKITHKFQSTVSMRIVLETFYDTIGLFFRVRQKKIIQPSQGISISFTPIPENHKKPVAQQVK